LKVQAPRILHEYCSTHDPETQLFLVASLGILHPPPNQSLEISSHSPMFSTATSQLLSPSGQRPRPDCEAMDDDLGFVLGERVGGPLCVHGLKLQKIAVTLGEALPFLHFGFLVK
jgi:hypothetical protein